MSVEASTRRWAAVVDEAMSGGGRLEPLKLGQNRRGRLGRPALAQSRRRCGVVSRWVTTDVRSLVNAAVPLWRPGKAANWPMIVFMR